MVCEVLFLQKVSHNIIKRKSEKIRPEFCSLYPGLFNTVIMHINMIKKFRKKSMFEI